MTTIAITTAITKKRKRNPFSKAAFKQLEHNYFDIRSACALLPSSIGDFRSLNSSSPYLQIDLLRMILRSFCNLIGRKKEDNDDEELIEIYLEEIYTPFHFERLNEYRAKLFMKKTFFLPNISISLMTSRFDAIRFRNFITFLTNSIVNGKIEKGLLLIPVPDLCYLSYISYEKIRFELRDYRHLSTHDNDDDNGICKTCQIFEMWRIWMQDGSHVYRYHLDDQFYITWLPEEVLCAISSLSYPYYKNRIEITL
jgi:hypothetical protein